MGVPFEALLPYAVMLTYDSSHPGSTIAHQSQMFGLTGAGLGKLRHMQNGGKYSRYRLDTWDHQMMQRDKRLTGYLRGQSGNAIAPEGFELSNPWRLERRMT